MPQMLPSYWMGVFFMISIIFLMIVCFMSFLVLPFKNGETFLCKSNFLSSKSWF